MNAGHPPLVVIAAGAPFDGVRRSARAVADALTSYVEVLYVEPSRSPRGRTSRFAGLESIRRPALASRGDIHTLTPMTIPGHTRRGVRSIVRREVVRSVRSAIDALGVVPHAVLQQSLTTDILGTLGEAHSVAWATDAYLFGAELMGMAPSDIERIEASMASRADLAIAVTEPIAELWRARGVDAVIVPNGVDPLPTSEPTLRRDGAPGTIEAIVCGTLSPRLDLELLDATAAAGIRLTLVGPASFTTGRSGFDALTARPNVEWMGPVAHHELPGIYASVDVGLVPYTSSPFNGASFPLKPLEYLAAGLPVVSTDLPSVRSLGSPDIAIATGTDGFVGAIHDAAVTASDTARIVERRAFAADHSWDRSARGILAAIGLEP